MLTEITFADHGHSVRGATDSPELENAVSEVLGLADDFSSQKSFVFQTSGSTGTPKEIFFCRDEIVRSAKLTASFFDLRPGARVLLALPIRFVAGKMMVYRSIVNEWKLWVALPSSNPLRELNSPIDFAALTPHQLAVVWEQCPEKLTLIDTIICGGGAIGKQLSAKIQHAGIRVFETYGMTETLTHVAVKAQHLGETTFHALPGITFGYSENQCLSIQCNHLLSSPVITQDLAEIISPTEMRWLGRNDFVINSGGIKISPERIEEALSEVFNFPFYIGGLRDEIMGEKLTIFVEELPLNFPWQDRLNEVVLPQYERPKQMVAIGKFERTNSGKIIRKRNVL